MPFPVRFSLGPFRCLSGPVRMIQWRFYPGGGSMRAMALEFGLVPSFHPTPQFPTLFLQRAIVREQLLHEKYIY